jgi:hypothetical protein
MVWPIQALDGHLAVVLHITELCVEITRSVIPRTNFGVCGSCSRFHGDCRLYPMIRLMRLVISNLNHQGYTRFFPKYGSQILRNERQKTYGLELGRSMAEIPSDF